MEPRRNGVPHFSRPLREVGILILETARNRFVLGHPPAVHPSAARLPQQPPPQKQHLPPPPGSLPVPPPLCSCHSERSEEPAVCLQLHHPAQEQPEPPE